MRMIGNKTVFEGNHRGPVVLDGLSIDALVLLAREAGIKATKRWKPETIKQRLKEQGV